MTSKVITVNLCNEFPEHRERFEKLLHKSRCWWETDDCSVIALALALNIRYADAWYRCRKAGRKYRGGIDINDFIPLLGRTKTIWGHRTFEKDHKKGTLILQTPGHVCAMQDGIVYDYSLYYQPFIRAYKIYT